MDETPEIDPDRLDASVDALRDRILDHLIGFVADLRRRGVRVPSNAAIDGARALGTVGLDDADRAQDALRAAIITDEADVDTFDALFPEFWRALWEAEDPDPWEPPEMHAPPGAAFDRTADDRRTASAPGDRDVPNGDGDEPAGQRAGDPSPDGTTDEIAEERTVRTAVYSPAGPSRPIEGTAVPDANLGEDRLGRAVDELGDAIAQLRGARWDRPGTDRVDVRRVLRRSVTTGGAVSELPHTSRARSETKAVLLVDVSQSVLDTIERGVLVRVIAEIHARWRRVRTFFFDTDLREVTEAFEATDPDRAIAALERAEAAWGGGTRIGHAIEAALRRSPPVIDRDTAVIVVSDGLEMGEIDRLERVMADLDRTARVVLWLNPLAADPAFEPACRGMEVAVPHADGLFAFTGPDDLREVARQLQQRGAGGRIGYAYDPRRLEEPAERTPGRLRNP